MRLVAIVIIAAAAKASWAGIGEEQRNVPVCMDENNDSLVIGPAKATTSQIFARIGVKIQWHRMSECPASGAILVNLSQPTQDDQRPGALAYALPFEGTHIVVFYDRVKQTSDPGLEFRLLAYVMAHEIAHILERINVHSQTGIMKARFDRRDQFAMAKNRFRFTNEDVERIDAGLNARCAPAQAVAHEHAPALNRGEKQDR